MLYAFININTSLKPWVRLHCAAKLYEISVQPNKPHNHSSLLKAGNANFKLGNKDGPTH